MKDNKESVKEVLSSEQYTEISSSKINLIDELVLERDTTTMTINEKVELLKKIRAEIERLENRFIKVNKELSEKKRYRRSIKNELGRQTRIVKDLNKSYIKQKKVDVSRFYTENEKNKTR